MLDAKAFGQEIRENLGGISLSALARNTGLNRQQIHRYLAGEAVPRADAFLKICAELDMDPRRFMPGKGPGSREQTTYQQEFLGGVAAPGETQIKAGIYDAYSVANPSTDTIFRYAIRFYEENDEMRAYTRIPRNLYPMDTPKEMRVVTGRIYSKMGDTLHLISHLPVLNSDEKLVNYTVFAPEDYRNGIRLGLQIGFDMRAPSYPYVSKCALAPSNFNSYQAAFRRCGPVTESDGPADIMAYFGQPPSSNIGFAVRDNTIV